MASRSRKKNAKKHKVLPSVQPSVVSDSDKEVNACVEGTTTSTSEVKVLSQPSGSEPVLEIVDESGGSRECCTSGKTAVSGPSHEESTRQSSSKKSKKRQNKKAPDVKLNSQAQASSGTKDDEHFTFEDQLEWCVGQLELGLLRRTGTKAQKESNEKSIKTLRSLKVPLPRKRQLMRSLFGDYRSKMIAAPHSSASLKQPRVSVVERDVADGCGKFFKYKHSHSESDRSPKVTDGHCGEEQLFRFDFVVDS